MGEGGGGYRKRKENVLIQSLLNKSNNICIYHKVLQDFTSTKNKDNEEKNLGHK